MKEERWRDLLRRFPGRCIYPDFNPDRKREPWKPTPPQARDWRRGDTRKVTFIVRQRGGVPVEGDQAHSEEEGWV